MEILALLLLGFIAMLAIVPPIIRGKLEESPLSTTRDFQRSMKEMAHSIEPYGALDQASYEEARRDEGMARAGYEARGHIRPVPARYSRRSSAAVRRNRITAFLALFAAIWGVATLISGGAWCLAIFSIATVLLVVYWAMTIIIPSVYSKTRREGRTGQISHPPKRQAS